MHKYVSGCTIIAGLLSVVSDLRLDKDNSTMAKLVVRSVWRTYCEVRLTGNTKLFTLFLSGVTQCSLVSAGVSDEHSACIFRVEDFLNIATNNRTTRRHIPKRSFDDRSLEELRSHHLCVCVCLWDWHSVQHESRMYGERVSG